MSGPGEPDDRLHNGLREWLDDRHAVMADDAYAAFSSAAIAGAQLRPGFVQLEIRSRSDAPGTEMRLGKVIRTSDAIASTNLVLSWSKQVDEIGPDAELIQCAFGPPDPIGVGHPLTDWDRLVTGSTAFQLVCGLGLSERAELT